MPFLGMSVIYPYLYPAYGLARLANDLDIGVKVQEWNQTIRAAIVLTAMVEDMVSLNESRLQRGERLTSPSTIFTTEDDPRWITRYDPALRFTSTG